MREFFESIMPNVIPKLPALWNATLETLAMTGISALYILVIGMALGILLTVTKKGGLLENANDRLLKERNEAGVEFLLGFIPTTSVLVVCGAGHLPGADGLISLLRGAGYSVEPVN